MRGCATAGTRPRRSCPTASSASPSLASSAGSPEQEQVRLAAGPSSSVWLRLWLRSALAFTLSAVVFADASGFVPASLAPNGRSDRRNVPAETPLWTTRRRCRYLTCTMSGCSVEARCRRWRRQGEGVNVSSSRRAVVASREPGVSPMSCVGPRGLLRHGRLHASDRRRGKCSGISRCRWTALSPVPTTT
jgi:hypothetical protein